MHHTEGNITGRGGRSIYWQGWAPDGPPRALVLLVHGAGEHGGRYGALAGHLNERGMAVAALDHNGHGRSQGRPGYVEAFGDYTADLASFHDHMEEQFPGIPVILLGHSLGGLVGGHYLLQAQDRLVGAAFSGPLVSIEPAPGALQRLATRVLGTLVPRLGVLQLQPDGVSRDPAVVADYVADPLVFHGRISARMLREMFAAMDVLQERAGEITLPLLVMHGEKDRMTAPAGSRLLHERASSADKSMTIYPGLYHEILNEPEREQVWGDLCGWCEAHL